MVAASRFVVQRYMVQGGFFVLFVIASLFSFWSIAHAQTERKVLLLNSYSYDQTWTRSITDSVNSVLGDEGGVQLAVEFMDSKRHNSPAYFVDLFTLYKKKYSRTVFDLVITSDDNAANFALQHRDSLFPDTPIVFCGVNNLALPERDDFHNATGVLEVPGYRGTFDAALLLHPHLKTVYLVNESSTIGESDRKHLQRILDEYSGKFDAVWLEDYSAQDLETKLAGLDNNSIVLLLSFFVNKQSETFKLSEGAAFVSRASVRPVYSMWEYFLGEGILGGMLTSGTYQGLAAARIALKILEGAKAESIPIVSKTANKLMFDYVQMKRFRIDVDDLPPGSVVLNEPMSLMRMYRMQLIIAGVIIAVLTLACIILGMNIRAKRRAERKLAAVNMRLEEQVMSRTTELERIMSAEKAQTMERKRLLAVLDAMPGYVYVLHPNHRLDYVNQMFREAFGDPGDLPCYVVMYGRDKPCEECPTFEVFKTGEPRTWERTDPQGGVWLIQDIPFTSTEGTPLVLEMARDVTERKKIAEDLKGARKLMDDAQTLGSIGGWEFSPATGEAMWTDNQYRLYGYHADEIEDLSSFFLERIVHPDERERVQRALDSVFLDKKQIQMEYKIIRKNGEVRTMAGVVVPEVDEFGEIRRVFGSNHDITDRKRTEEALVQAKKAAESSNLAKSQFLANMSHEIRTPLNGVLGMLQLLRATAQDEDQSKYTEVAMQSSKRLTTLLSDILDLSRVEAGKLEIVSEYFDLRDTFESIAHLFSPLAAEKKLDLRLEIDEKIPQIMLGDGARLLQVLSNLVGNAIKFTPRGSVGVNASLLPMSNGETCRVLFSIQDTGIGICDDMVDKSFEAFTQVESDYKRKYQGAGLGLTISRRLVELMQGNMSVESESGVGSTFYFSLPFQIMKSHTPQVKPPAPVVSKADQEKGRSLKVLLAEDDWATQYATVSMFEQMGHEVHVAVDGEQALMNLRQESYDLVLMDVQMPKMDGAEATRAIRAGEAGDAQKDIPIIAVTAYAMAGDKEQFLAAGMDDYLSKPMMEEDLQAVLDKVLTDKVQ